FSVCFSSKAQLLPGSFKWCMDGFTYLGINISSSYDQIYRKNYTSLINKTKTELERWMDLPLSLIGRVNTIKMSILPKFIYLFQCVPLKVPMTFFKDLDKVISLFLWQKKVPRVKLLTLQAPYAKGGLNLPNFRMYYLTSQFRILWMWIYSNELKSISGRRPTQNSSMLVLFGCSLSLKLAQMFKMYYWGSNKEENNRYLEF
uniref:Reverse transcriptase domain-containing protein n=1 Tax=Xiphophorus couchianus TaxID=32473 RepID=A0A3B5LII0_9TELE